MNQEQFIKGAMENYPEAGRGNSLTCLKWNYEATEFTFYDEEEDKTYNVDMKMLREGIKKLLKIIEDGHYFNCGRVPNLLSDGYDSDAQDYDALVQCAIFGEVRYG